MILTPPIIYMQVEVTGTLNCTSAHVYVYAVVAKEKQSCEDESWSMCTSDPSNACLYTCSCGSFFCRSFGITVLPRYAADFDVCELSVIYT